MSFRVNGYQIRTNSGTTFEGTACGGLKSGDKVEVKGLSQPDNSVVAGTVRKK